MSNIKVISHLDEPLEARFDGVDYYFEPGVPTILTMEAATFIFQLGEEDRSRSLNALGLLVPGKHSYQEALKKLDQISFVEGKFTFDDEQNDEGELDEHENTPDVSGASEDPTRRKGTAGRRPHVDRSGGAGAQPSGGAPAEPL
jgi:hypothetical protein